LFCCLSLRNFSRELSPAVMPVSTNHAPGQGRPALNVIHSTDKSGAGAMRTPVSLQPSAARPDKSCRIPEIPSVGKIPALLGLHRLHCAVAAVEENAFAVRFVLKRQTAAICAQPGIALNEIELGDPEENRHLCDLVIAQFHLPRPATALCAAHAFVVNWHRGKLPRRGQATASVFDASERARPYPRLNADG
jgi:hypothetical protein